MCRAPVEKSFFQITSNYDDTFMKEEADWKVIIVEEKGNIKDDKVIWRPGQNFQVNKKIINSNLKYYFSYSFENQWIITGFH